ncbi:MAG: aminoglycoside phosphotransferase [Opitutaceae bacterium]|nr:aminoglycoside phosphotransferase [Opitutaceae bacterium]
MLPESIAAEFDVPGQVVTVLSIDTGNVNDTYQVIKRTTYSEVQFVLQRISQAVFPKPELVMANMKAITDYGHERLEEQAESPNRIWQLPKVIPTLKGEDFFVDAEGEYWRALSMIASATSHEKLMNLEHAHEAGFVLGHFQSVIADFPIDQLEDTLPGFHITPGYLKYHDEVVKTEGAQKKLSASSEARRIEEFVQERRGFASVLEDALQRGELQLRPIHGDPKITNIMMDNITGKGTAIIDLDTVKPGLIHYDFGDCVRSVCNPAGEEAKDLSCVFVDVDSFEALVRGYLKQAKKFLTDWDRNYLYDSVRLITFELGLRFFTDYLAGDVYFKTNYPAQNLNRGRVQMKLCESIETRESMMRRVLKRM